MNPIHVTLTKDDRALARRVHSMFAAKAGSDHIASVISLATLAALTRQYSIKSVIEFGSGIGTITYLLLARLPRQAVIVSTEHNDWCRQQFEQNLPDSERDRVNLLPGRRPDIVGQFDLVVIDGPVSAGSAFAREGSIIFVEGTRAGTWAPVAADLVDRGLRCSLYRRSERRLSIRWRSVRWRWRHRLRIRLPQIKIKEKCCSIGVVERAPEARLGRSAIAVAAAE